MDGLTVEEKGKALVYAKNGADFMFIPSSNLCNLIAIGSEKTIGINKTLIAILLTRKPIRLGTDTVIKYCKGTLDVKNTWLLDNGDIKVVPQEYKKPELVKKNNIEEKKNG